MEINNNDVDDEWSNIINDSPSPSSYIQQLPESIKLILATLFVASILHVFFTTRSRRRSNNNCDIERLRDELSGRGAVGSATTTEKTTNSDDTEGQVLGDSASAEEDEKPNEKNMTMRRNRKNNVANRNYDALICKKKSNEYDDSDEEVGEFGSLCRGKKKNPSKKKNESSSEDADSITETLINPQQPPKKQIVELKSQTNHPGLRGYYNWHSTITSLYRIYAIPNYEEVTTLSNSKRIYHQATLPMHPSSERGQVPLYIEVTNHTSHPKINVYWIDYKGNEVFKGSISNNGGTWNQTTFIGHPWTFRIGVDSSNGNEGDEENVLLKYAPFRVIPNILGAETSRIESSGNVEGMQKFILRDVPEGHVMMQSTTNEQQQKRLVPVCWVEDAILPEPPLVSIHSANHSSSLFTTSAMNRAIQWSCQQLQREDAIYHGNGIASSKRLLQYLRNICLHPDEPKYRKLRVGNPIFQQTIYNTGARGVLLACGFEELYGFMECGPGESNEDDEHHSMLGLDRIQQISDAMMVVNQTLKIMEDSLDAVVEQPEGGDGFGRAGFGHAGGMNF